MDCVNADIKPRIFFDFFYVGDPKQDDMILRESKRVQFSILGLVKQMIPIPQ